MKNRSLKVSLVRDTPNGEAPPTTTLTADQINEIASAQVQNLAMTVGVVLLTKKAADTLSELILIAGRKYI